MHIKDEFAAPYAAPPGFIVLEGPTGREVLSAETPAARLFDVLLAISDERVVVHKYVLDGRAR